MNNIEKDYKKFALGHNVSSMLIDDYNRKVVDTYIEPTIIEERKLNATQISVFSRLFMERILFIGTEINSDVANVINSQLLYLEMENPEKPISIYINSPGGSVYDGLSIYDLFKYVSSPISTTCIGMAASMGAVLLSSGDNGKRFALPNSQIMIHQPLSSLGYAQASDIEIANNEVQKCKKTLYNILCENTGKSYDEITAACDRNNWFTSQEAIDFGLIDEVIKKKK
jgi:ATP-dependent Clp protease protease subunit